VFVLPNREGDGEWSAREAELVDVTVPWAVRPPLTVVAWSTVMAPVAASLEIFAGPSSRLPVPERSASAAVSEPDAARFDPD